MTVDRLRVPHEPTDDCARDHCHACGVDEPIRPGRRRPYQVCGECGHVYWSAGQLRRAHRAYVWRDWRSVRLRGNDWDRMSLWVWLRALLRPARVIWFCQHCAHDF